MGVSYGGSDMRLAKHLAHAGVASRRAAEQLIFHGHVTVGGKVVTDPATDVDGSKPITVDGRPVGGTEQERAVYILNKPPGIVSTSHDTHGRKTVVDLVHADRRLYPVGRLDADSTGLILLTDDGELAHRLTHPRFEVPKTYRAVVRNPPVREPALRKLREGIELDDGRTSPAKVRRISSSELEITIHEGRKRQIRRMCEAIDHRVESLERVAFGPLRLGSLPVGGHRRLTPAEVERLRAD
jgi:23S rRNA pseudouridine2605 synthase